MSLHLDEPVGIDPRVNIVFLTLFGDPEHERVLLDFLNAVLTPSAPITRAVVRNPFHPAQFEGHKSLILDIQAEDEAGGLSRWRCSAGTTGGWISGCSTGGRDCTLSSWRRAIPTRSSDPW